VTLSHTWLRTFAFVRSGHLYNPRAVSCMVLYLDWLAPFAFWRQCYVGNAGTHAFHDGTAIIIYVNSHAGSALTLGAL
jgi:hypothetical protein